MRPFSKIFSDILKSVSSSGVQFCITLFTTPIMTRLYEPTAYSTFGIINTMATTIIGIGLLSLPNAYPLAKHHVARKELLHAVSFLLCILVVLTGVGAGLLALADYYHLGMNISGIALLMLPILVLTFGLRQITVSMATEGGHFGRLSLGQMLEPLCSRGNSIALGAAFGSNPVFILLSVAMGHLITVLTIFKKIPKLARIPLRSFVLPLPVFFVTLRNYRDFVLYGTASQQTQPLVMLGVQMAVVVFFSSHIAGQYILALSILAMPVSLISLATAPIVYRHFIELERKRPSALLHHLIFIIFIYTIVGVCILSPLYFFGEEIFGFAFGDVWSPAGRIAGILSIAHILSFAVVGVQSVFRVTGHLKLLFILEFCIGAVLLVLAAFCFKNMNLGTAMGYLSLFWFLRNFIVLTTSLIVASRLSPTRE